MSLEFPRKIQDVQEVMSETAGKATKGRGEDAWRLEIELETKVVSNGVEGAHMDPNVECHHETEASTNSRRLLERKIIRVESEDTQDHVREANDIRRKLKK